MAFPGLGTPATTQTAAGSTTHALTLPGSLTTGNVLLLAVQCADSIAPSGLGGWTALHSNLSGGWRAVYARVVDGSEGSTLVLSTSTATRISAVVVEISDVYGSALSSVEWGGVNYISSVDYPRAAPEVTASWGAADNLWLSIYMGDSTDFGVDASPADGGYTLVASVVPTSTSSSHVYMYERDLAAATEQPGDYDFGVLRAASIVTVVVRPADFVTPNSHRHMLLGIG